MNDEQWLKDRRDLSIKDFAEKYAHENPQEDAYASAIDEIAALESERDELRAQVEAMRIAVSGYLQALDNGEGEYEVRRVRHKMRQSVASLKAKP